MPKPSDFFAEAFRAARASAGSGSNRPSGAGGVFGFGGGLPFGNIPWPFPRAAKRARKGDVRAGILALLGEGPRNGYQIMRELEERSRGLWHPSSSAVYPALQQLQDEGLVRAEESGTARVYHLTDEGRRYLEEHRSETEAPWDWETSATDGELLELFGQIRHIGAALWQIANSGQPEQIVRARKILTDARRSLYRIVSDEEESDE